MSSLDENLNRPILADLGQSKAYRNYCSRSGKKSIFIDFWLLIFLRRGGGRGLKEKGRFSGKKWIYECSLNMQER